VAEGRSGPPRNRLDPPRRIFPSPGCFLTPCSRASINSGWWCVSERASERASEQASERASVPRPFVISFERDASAYCITSRRAQGKWRWTAAEKREPRRRRQRRWTRRRGGGGGGEEEERSQPPPSFINIFRSGAVARTDLR